MMPEQDNAIKGKAVAGPADGMQCPQRKQQMMTPLAISAGEVRRIIEFMNTTDRRIGQVAVRAGKLRPQDLHEILLEQARRGGLFGEAAIRLKLLTSESVDTLLGIQSDDAFHFGLAAEALDHAAPGEASSSEYLEMLHSAGPGSGYTASSEVERAHGGARSRIVLRRINEFAALPQSTMRVVASLDDPKVDLDKVAGVLSMDPGLVATLLRVVNSAGMGMRSEINSVKQAIVTLGVDKLRSLVIAVGIIQKFHSVPTQVAAQFWNHALRTGEWSRRIGKEMKVGEGDELFLCGLLHNIGDLLIHQYFQGEMRRIRERVDSGSDRFRAELDVLGETSPDIGAFLLHQWNLPATLVQTTMYHRTHVHILNRTAGLQRDVFAVNMAWAIGAIGECADDLARLEELEKLSARYARTLRLPAQFDIERISDEVEQSLSRLTRLFSGT